MWINKIVGVILLLLLGAMVKGSEFADELTVTLTDEGSIQVNASSQYITNQIDSPLKSFVNKPLASNKDLKEKLGDAANSIILLDYSVIFEDGAIVFRGKLRVGLVKSVLGDRKLPFGLKWAAGVSEVDLEFTMRLTVRIEDANELFRVGIMDVEKDVHFTASNWVTNLLIKLLRDTISDKIATAVNDGIRRVIPGSLKQLVLQNVDKLVDNISKKIGMVIDSETVKSVLNQYILNCRVSVKPSGVSVEMIFDSAALLAHSDL